MPLTGPSLASPLRTRAPRGPIEVDWPDPINRDLQYWWPFTDVGGGRTVYELVSGANATFNAAMDTGSWDQVDDGVMGVNFDGTAGDKLQVSDEDNLSLAATSTSIGLWFRASSWTSGDGLIGKFTVVGGDREWGLWLTGTSNQLQFFRYDAAGFNGAGALTNAAFFDGAPTFAAGRTLANGDIETLAWKPSLGLLKGSASSPDTAWKTSGPGHLAIGAYQDDATGNEFACDLWNVRKLGRALSDAEFQDLAENPWAGALELGRRSWFLPASGGGGIINQMQKANLGADLYDGTLQ